ncbi:GLUG motif-containing protein [Halovenus salina]|uniref:GLUG motif-containing protein n=1 Tax=Halovenus salina TaxID=1510225 RepID=A0ABD5W7P5_9EURY
MEVSGGYQVSDVYDDAVVGNQNVGGLVGENTNGGQIIDSSVRGKITGDSSEIAGLVGFNDGTVENSVSTATVTIEELGNRHVAGLVGTNEGTISDSYATGDVTVNDAQDDFPRVGGLVGENFGTIERSHATGDVTGVEGASSSNHNYGGLVGIHWVGTIEESFATGDVETDGRAGSLVGRVSQLYCNDFELLRNR